MWRTDLKREDSDSRESSREEIKKDNEEYYVVGEFKKGDEARQIAIQKIVSDLWRLFILTPPTYIIKKMEEDGTAAYALAYRMLPECRTLQQAIYDVRKQTEKEEKLVEGENPAKKYIDDLDKFELNDRKRHLNKYFKILRKRLQIEEESLAKASVASVFLDDRAIGRYFTDIGIVEQQQGSRIIFRKTDSPRVRPGSRITFQNKAGSAIALGTKKGTHTVVKISFESANLFDNPKDPFILNPDNIFFKDSRAFKDEFGHYHDIERGEKNLRFREVFQGLGEEKILMAINDLIQFDRITIAKIVSNEELINEDLLTVQECEDIQETLFNRKTAFLKKYKDAFERRRIAAEETDDVPRSPRHSPHKCLPIRNTFLSYEDFEEINNPYYPYNRIHQLVLQKRSEKPKENISKVSFLEIKAPEKTEKSLAWQAIEDFEPPRFFLSVNRQHQQILKKCRSAKNDTEVSVYLYSEYLKLLKSNPKGELCKAVEKSLGKVFCIELSDFKSVKDKLEALEPFSKFFTPNYAQLAISQFEEITLDYDSFKNKAAAFFSPKQKKLALYAHDAITLIKKDKSLPAAEEYFPLKIKKIIEAYNDERKKTHALSK